ncbi:LD-carboxypeptidase [Halobacillus litoralis]|uniref:S66 family peptidase n=1 Tax=Halobacillus litoralis TaxID=45668 RepID=UPI001CD4E715|nr:S66 peptidase family protein [Halobacillus litoralis]MCA0969725.1 LD-carboxypeptidase [Halobacillus litoralis]
MYPKKLSAGDEVRVISPAESLSIIAEDQRKLAMKRLESLGLKVTFSTYSDGNPSLKERLHDLHEAFADSNVKGILTTIGGFNSNQLLSYIDYEIIAENPKIFCGFSDITALSNAIHRKTGLVTYSGPHFSSFGMEKGIDYTIEYFEKVFFHTEPFSVEPADHWSNDLWFLDQDNRTFHPNEGYHVIQTGEASGRIVGGNLCTLNLLQGTPYMPSLKDVVLFLEDDEMTFPETFDRDLQSLIHQPDFEKVKGLVIGKFESKSEMDLDRLKKIIRSKEELKDIPVIAEASFGHTTPRFTFPIGGEVSIQAASLNEGRIRFNHF